LYYQNKHHTIFLPLRIILQLNIVGIGERIGIKKKYKAKGNGNGNGNGKGKGKRKGNGNGTSKGKGKGKGKKIYKNLIITISCYKTCIKSMHIPTHK